jgi:hypothetical protein
MNGRSSFMRKMQVQIGIWDAEICRLKAKTICATAEARPHLECAIQEIDDLRNRAADKLQEAVEVDDAAWDDVQDGFEASWYSLSDGVRSAKERLTNQ